MLTLQDSIDFSGPFIEYSPLTAGTGSQPAVGFASITRNMIMNAPFTWGWNRAEYATTSTFPGTVTVQGVSDYTIPLADFSYLEKVTLTNSDGKVFEVKDVYNTFGLAPSDAGVGNQQRPSAVAVKSVIYGTSVTLRFLGTPDAAYNVTLIYQKLPISFQSFSIASAANAAAGNTVYTGVFSPASFTPGYIASVTGMSAANSGTFSIVAVTPTTLTLANPSGVSQSQAGQVVNQSWGPIPDSFQDVFNNLFLAEALQTVDDARGAQFRQRGIAALLSKAEGLTSMQRNMFAEQALSRDAQTLIKQLSTQQGSNARGI